MQFESADVHSGNLYRTLLIFRNNSHCQISSIDLIVTYIPYSSTRKNNSDFDCLGSYLASHGTSVICVNIMFTFFNNKHTETQYPCTCAYLTGFLDLCTVDL